MARLADGATAYRVHGDRGPWVVLVPGLATPMVGWDALAGALAAAGFRVLRYDQLGRGLSDRPAVRYDADLFVRELDGLTRALAIDAACFVGWSLGCVVTSRFAARAPDRVQRLVHIAPAMFIEPPLFVRVLARAPFGRRLLASRAAAFVEQLPFEHVSHPERFTAYAAAMREQLRYPGFAAALASTVIHFPWRSGPELRAVGEHPRPVLIVWGDDDPATPYANSPRVRAIFPRAELLTLRGARHAPHVDRADVVGDALIRFLRSSDATPPAVAP